MSLYSTSSQVAANPVLTGRPFSPLLRGAKTPEFRSHKTFKQIYSAAFAGAGDLLAFGAFAGALCTLILALATALGA